MQIFILIVIFIFCLGIRLYGPVLLTQRLLEPIIKVLKGQGAYSTSTALSIEKLNLEKKGLGVQFTRMGQYRLRALDALRETNIVQTTEDDKLFLNVENLMASRLVVKWPSLKEGLPE